MARKDVELVIRARQQATNAVSAVEEALKDLASAQQDIVKSGGSAESQMARLGRTISNFEKAVGGDATKKLADGLQDAEKALAGISAEAVEAEKRAAALGQEMEAAAKNTASLTAQADKLQATLKAEAASLKTVQSALSDQKAALREAERETARLANRQAQAATRVGEITTKLDGSSRVYNELAATMNQIGPPTRAMVKDFQAAGRAVERQGEALAKAQAGYADAATKAEAQRNVQAQLAKVVEETTIAVNSQKVAFAEATTSFNDNATAIRNAAKAEADIRKEIDRSNAARQRQAETSQKIREELESLTLTQERANAALARFASQAAGPALRSYGELRRGAADAKRAFEEQTQQTTELARAFQIMGPPTREQVVNFERSKAAAQALKSEYLALRDGAQALQQALRQRTTDPAGLAAQQARVAGIVQQTNAAVESARQSAARAAAENDKLGASWARMTSGTAQAASGFRRVDQEAESFNRELDRFYGSGRQALSLMQRIRGQLLSMAAAYVGLFGVVEGLNGIVKATSTVESATTRMTAVFGSAAAGAQELDFVRRTADRLNVSFGDLAKGYSQFAAATRGTAIAGQKTRDIFVRITEASIVMGLSMEDQQAIFLALTQIASKGKIQLEELSGQLGERLPGALNLMAKSMGITTAELLKMTEAGAVGAERLAGLALEIEKVYGGQLGAALLKTSSLIGGLQNAIFKAFVQVGEGGFMQAFNRLLIELTETLESAEGATFFTRLGAALGKATDLATLLVNNLDLVLGVLIAIAATRAIPIITGLGAAFTNLGTTIRGLPAQYTAARAAILATNTAAAATAPAAAATTAALAGTTVGLTATTAAATATSVSLGARLRAAFLGLAASVRTLPATLYATTGGFTAVGTASAVLGTGLGVLRTAVIALRAAFLALWSATGVGLVVAGASFLFAEWATSADEATEALDKHRRMIDSVKNAYDAAQRNGTKWAEELKKAGVTQFEVQQDIEKSTQGMKDAFADFYSSIKLNADGSTPFGNIRIFENEYTRAKDAVQELTRAYQDTGDVEKFREELNKIGKAAQDASVKQLVQDALDLANTVEGAKGRVEDASAALDVLEGTAKGTSEAVKELGLSTDGATAGLEASAAAAARYKQTLEGLAQFIPELKAEMEKLKDEQTINAEVGRLGFNEITPEVVDRARRAKTKVRTDYNKELFEELSPGTKVTPELFSMIFGEESYRSKAYNDGYGTPTIGYGSTRIRGRAVQYGDVVTEREAQQQAIADLDKLVAQIGAMVSVPLSKAQLNALASYAYNAGIGSLKRDGILGPLNRGDYAGAEKAIRNGVMTSKGKFVPGLKTRRAREADMFAAGADDPEVAAGIIEREQKVEEDRAKQRERTQETLTDGQREIEQQNLINAGKERQAEVEKAIYEARKDNPNISAEDAAKIGEQAGKLFDLQQQQKNAKKEDTQATKEANAALAQANALYAQQQAIRAQITQATKAGDTAKVQDLQTQLTEVSAKFDEAVAKARSLWEAVGGPAADTALTKIDTLGMKAETAGAKAAAAGNNTKVSWDTVDDTFATGLTGAFDKFAQAVANGEDAADAAKNAFLSFASDFLRQIAQMIIQQAILNAMQSFMPGFGTPGGGIGGAISGALFHNGGLVRTGGRQRMVNPAMFANAMSYHTGGIAGLKPNEVPAILERNEEVLERDDPRHILNGAGGGSGGAASPAQVKVVNAFDAGSFMSAGLATTEGEQAILNLVRANSSAFRAAMGG